jgi:PST family polysaccharide transporter
MLLPLITYPYLIRILGTELYGMVVFAQVIISYCSIIINYGFEATATKDISIYHENKTKISEIVSSVYIIKGVFWLILLLILLIVICIFPHFQKYKLLYIFTFSITFNEFLFPIWYFQGLEKMKYITFINLFVRIIFLILIFIFIKQKEDFLYVPLLNGIGALLGGTIALYMLFVKDEIRFTWQPIHIMRLYLKDSLPIFFSNITSSIKDRFNVIFIGSSLGMHDVAIYDLGIKVMTVFMQPIIISNNAIYPKIAREQNIFFVKKFIKISFIVVLILTLLVQPFLPFLLDFLSNNLEGTIEVTRILLISPIIGSISFILSRNILLAFGQYKYFSLGVIYTTVFYLMSIGIAYYFTLLNSVFVLAIITVATYLFELLYRLYICVKIKAFKINLFHTK